jgi:two-component system, OmpR family, response regulator
VPGQSASDTEVFSPTEKGKQQLKAGDTSLSATELELLVLVDGASSVAQIEQRIPEADRQKVRAALQKLAADGLIASIAEEAHKAASVLAEEGYYVSIARRSAAPREAAKGPAPTILVVDDDPDLQKLFKMYLSLEGFRIRSAVNQEEVHRGLGKQPVPDLVLLDVHLPDANGFDILAKMRRDPALRNIPVIMLTVEATREAVLKGLLGGANGYLTKPFEHEILTRAVRAVLGLPSPAA